jgi:hypothetical protein
MGPINENEPKYIVIKAIREAEKRADGELRPGTSEYNDLMANVEGQVQRVLEDERGER